MILSRVVLLGLLAASTLAAATPARAKVFDPVTFRLPNGMQVVVIENKRAPVVTHMVWYCVGSADEARGKSGIAHYLEHLMFKGTEKVKPGEFSRVVARRGGRDNAFTAQDYTGYFQTVAVEHLPVVMELEADRMANLRLTEALARPELDVVLEERRSRTDNEPSARLYEQVQAVMWLHHPYGTPVIGWENEIRKLTYQDAIDFWNIWYTPNNAVLIIAGAVTADEVRPLAEKFYGPAAPRAFPKRERVQEPEHVASARIEMVSDRVREPSWARRWHAPSYNAGETKHAYALQVLAEILGGGATSRLYRALVVEQGIATSAGADYEASRLDLGAFTVYGAPRPGGDLAQLEKAVEAVLAEVREKGVTDAEVARARLRLEAASVYARDSLGGGPRTMGVALCTGRSVDEVEAWPDRIREVTADQVNAAARAVLKDGVAVTSILRPAPAS